MAKRRTYNVNGELFKTKKALQNRVRLILWSYSDGEYLTFNDLEFMTDLLSNHPQADIKIGSGVAGMQVRQNPVYTQTQGFWIIRTDGTDTDFSYIECLTPTPKPKKVLRALRVAVEPDTQAFKQRFFDQHNGIAPCPITCETMTYTNCHVDHAPPNTFDVLAQRFLEEEGIDPNDVELLDEYADNRLQDELADQDLKRKWIDYHGEHAQLRVISRRANLSDVRRGLA